MPLISTLSVKRLDLSKLNTRKTPARTGFPNKNLDIFQIDRVVGEKIT
jgi:hypothetical protein